MSTPDDGDQQAPLGRRMAIGAAWVVAVRTAMRFVGLISTVILARLLVPADFGLVALATLVAVSLERLSAFNFSVWLVRHPDPQREHYDTVWTLSVLRGVITATVIALTAVPLGDFFDAPNLDLVLYALAAGQLLGGLQNVGIVDFQKHLAFHKEFQLLVTTRTGRFLVTVAIAFALRSYWALVAGLIAEKLLSLVLSYTLHHYRPRFSLAAWREVFGFSKWLLVGSLSGFVYGRMDTFFIGKFLSTQALGLYAVAREIADLASSEIVAPLRRVMLPGYAKMNTDPARLRSGFVDGFAIIALVGAPFAVGIALLGDPLVRLLLGEKWLAAIPLVKVLSVYALSSIVAANQGPILLAMGRARTLAVLTAIGIVLLAPVLWWTITRHGVIGAAVALSAVNALVVAIGLFVVLYSLNIRLTTLITQVWPTIIGLVLMALAVNTVIQPLRAAGWGSVAELLLGGATGVLVYTTVGLAIWRLRGRPYGPETRLLDEWRNWRTTRK